jgi:arylformamidase
MAGTEGALYRGYDRAGLDREYDNRTKVPGFDFAAFLAQCADRNARALAACQHQLDVPYGQSAAERLDIFPAGKPAAPVHVFFHGGYWRLLDKKDFSYVASGLVPHGVTTVIVNYALMPGVRMDDLLEQCRRSIDWVFAHIAGYGGDPQQVSVSGHSAGGHIAAMMMATDWSARGRHAPARPFTHVCAISGIFDLEPIRLCFLNDTLRMTAAEAARNSPIALAPRVDCPLDIVVGDREGDEYLRQSREFGQAWTTRDRTPGLVVMRDTDHFSIRAALGDPDSEMVALALRLAK